LEVRPPADGDGLPKRLSGAVPGDPGGQPHAWQVGFGYTEPDPTDEDLRHALMLEALGYRITWYDYREGVPFSVIQSLLGLKAGRAARQSADAKFSFPLEET